MPFEQFSYCPLNVNSTTHLKLLNCSYRLSWFQLNLGGEKGGKCPLCSGALSPSSSPGIVYPKLAIECYGFKMVYNCKKCTVIDTMISTVIGTNIHTCTKIIPILYHEHAIELANWNFGFLSLEYSNYDIMP